MRRSAARLAPVAAPIVCLRGLVAAPTARLLVRVAVAAAFLLAPAAPARAQDGRVYGAEQFFLLTWEPVDYGGKLSIGGYVTNTYGLEAVGVRLMVESLDAAGRITARTIGYVNYPIPPSSRGYFEIFPPEKASSYRVFVLSWDWRRSPSG